jgi:NTP pyrophosphatase (non-canonical NTP hydrolase)
MMNLRDYQRAAMQTARIHDSDDQAKANWSMGLAGEAGELIDLVKKDIFMDVSPTQAKLESEAGDVLWYLANLCFALEIDLQRVAEENIKKLRARYPDGFVDGGGIRE